MIKVTLTLISLQGREALPTHETHFHQDDKSHIKPNYIAGQRGSPHPTGIGKPWEECCWWAELQGIFIYI